MSTTCCADAGVAVYHALSDLPGSVRALFGRAAGAGLFDRGFWYETIIAAAIAPGAAACFVVCGGSAHPALVMPMRIDPAGHGLGGLTTLYTCRYQPLCDPDADDGALHTAFAAFARYCRRWPTVRLDALDDVAPWWPALRAGAAAAGCALRVFDHFGNWHEHVAGQGWATYLGARPGQLRETIRRRMARAERTGARFQLVTGGAALEPGIAAYEAVYARSWKPEEPFPRFHAALMRVLAAQDRLRLGLYWHGDQPAAAQLWVLDDGWAMVLKLAHDETLKAESPGTVLTAWMLRHLLDQEHATEIDFGRGDDPYKRLWARERRQRVGAVLVNPRLPRGLAFLARHALGRVRHALAT